MDTTHRKTMEKFLMAYITQDGKGPYPNKAGEFCGNHNPDEKYNIFYSKMKSFGKREELSEKYRFSLPRPCEAFTIAEGVQRGWVGLYLKEDCKHVRIGVEIEVPTPPKLMEPGAINHQCGLCKGTGQIVLFSSSCECDCTKTGL
jgi:hypothetical protein